MRLEDLKEKSVIELKAYIYDLSAQGQQIQETMRVVNEMIGQKIKEESEAQFQKDRAEEIKKEE